MVAPVLLPNVAIISEIRGYFVDETNLADITFSFDQNTFPNNTVLQLAAISTTGINSSSYNNLVLAHTTPGNITLNSSLVGYRISASSFNGTHKVKGIKITYIY
jgi:hypothetical protein